MTAPSIVETVGAARIMGDLLGDRKIKNGLTNCVNPAHADKHPSMSIDVQKGVFNCFACGVQGGALDFAVLRGVGRTPAEAAAELAIKYGQATNGNGHHPAPVPLPERPWPYFPKMAEFLGWEYVDRYDFRDGVGPAIKVPTWIDAERRGKTKVRGPRNAEGDVLAAFEDDGDVSECGLIGLPAFLDYAAGTESPRVVIVAGETDLLAWEWSCKKTGIQAPAISNSTGEASKLKPFSLPHFKGVHVTIAYDRDEKGAEGAASNIPLLEAAGAASVRYVPPPSPYKDIRDYISAGHSVVDFLKHIEASSIKPPEEWAEPVPVSQFGVPEFPIGAFHYKHSEWIEDITKGAQVAPDMPGTILLSVLSTCLARKFEVKVGGRWVEPLNIWTMVTARSGERKTPILTEAKSALVEYEMDRQVAEKEDLIRQRATYKAAESRLSIASKMLAKSPLDDKAIKAHAEAIKNLAETPEPKWPFRLLGDDTTPESLVAMMAHQDERLALFSSEGGMLKTVMGAQYNASGIANRDVLLKTYSGESIAQDRKNSASNSLRRPALTLGLFVQPTVLDKLVRDPDNTDLGLLARFLLCNCPSKIGFREVELIDPDPMIAAAFRTNIRELLELPLPQKPEIIALSPEALATLNAFRQEIELRMRPDNDLFYYQDFGAKIPGHAVRIAGNLAIAEGVLTMSGVPTSISRQAIDSGILLARYYLASAIKAIGNAELDPDVASAKRILGWIERHRAPIIQTRDIFQGLKGPRSSIQRMDQLRRPIDFLINSGWLAAGDPPKSPGDPPRSLKTHPNLQKSQLVGDLGDHP